MGTSNKQGRSVVSFIFLSSNQTHKLQQYDCLTASGQTVSVMAANQEQAFLACSELLSIATGDLIHIRLCHEW
jgi:hypothetical protein